MNIDAFGDLLEDAGLGTKGVDLFKHEMPDDAKVGILLRLPYEGVPIDHELPGYFRTKFQVIVRAARDATGWDLANRIQAALTFGERDLTVEGSVVMRANFCRPRTLPLSYQRSDGNGKEWSIHFDFCFCSA